ncbi:MAG: YebC/PmpR family DNA-binding transcriptional regulator [Candidatus Paceibacterota bacterium]
MSGHNKWSQIKHKKGITDAKKSKIFSKLVRFISVEAKLSKGDINAPGLRAAIEKAKKVNMPSENIERAIKKAGENEAQMDSITYEAYGPGGVGIIIETLTDSRNRTAQDVKHILTKNGFILGGIGSVIWSFTKPARNASHGDAGGEKWEPVNTISLSDEDLELLDKLVEELEENDDIQDVYTNAE